MQLDLTGIELDMLEFASEGWSHKEVAARHRVTEQTVKNRWQALFRKLRARNRAHALMIAVRRGILR